MNTEDLRGARYSEVERRVWNDSWFRSLSPIPPCGAGLWLYLLTTPELGSLPGLIVEGESAMAEHLAWPLKAFREAFAEVSAKGTVKADWRARVVVVLNAIGRHRPESPNVVKSWRQQWFEVPECALKIEYYRKLKAFVEGLSEGFRKAFAEAVPDPSPNQDQDQDQDQDQEISPPVSPSPRGQPAAPLRLMPGCPQKRQSRRKALTAWPDDFAPSESNVAYARDNQIDLEQELGKFQRNALANGKRFADWQMAFRNWLGNAVEWRRPTAQATPARAGLPELKKMVAKYEREEQEHEAK